MKLACCGLDCQTCEAFVATEKNDNTLRKQVAQKWSKLYNVPIKMEHINCTGCNAEGVKFFHCENTCKVKKCCTSKGLDNCAGCTDYACNDLKEIFAFGPEPKKRLDALR